MARTKRIRIAAVLAAAAALATACGSSSAKESSATTAKSAATTAAATTATTAAATTAAPTTAAATTTAKPVETAKINLACAPSITGVPLEYAMKNGLDKKHSLALSCVQVQAGPQLAAAMLAGDINIAGVAPANIYPLLDGGADMVGFQPVLDRELFDIIVRKDFPLPNAAAGWEGVMKDLAKAKIGVVAKGAAAEDIARGLFTLAGLNPDDATYIATGLPATTLPAMSNGQIDAALTLEPGVTLAVTQGIAVAPFSIGQLTGPKEMNWGSLFYSASRKYVTANAPVLKRFQETYQEALTWMTDPANKDEVVTFITTYLSMDKATATKLLERNLPFFSKATAMQADRYDQVGDFFNKIGKAKKAWHVADFTVDLAKL